MPDSKTWIAIGITFMSAVYIFYDSIQLGNIYGDLLGLVTALGLAIGAVTIRSAKKKNLVPAGCGWKIICCSICYVFH
jgi:drug/metabolite transporter (DMT)-like permease